MSELMPYTTEEVRQNRLAIIRQAIALGHVGGNEDTEWLLEDVDRLEHEIARLKHARVTKRERREWEDIEGDATVLRGYIREFGETPSMTASSRDHWKNRAEQAEALLTARAQEIEQVKAIQEQMMSFATTKPSPQQTRQKSAREMVELFAQELAAALVSRAPQVSESDEALAERIASERENYGFDNYVALIAGALTEVREQEFTARAPAIAQGPADRPHCVGAYHIWPYPDDRGCQCGDKRLAGEWTALEAPHDALRIAAAGVARAEQP